MILQQITRREKKVYEHEKKNIYIWIQNISYDKILSQRLTLLALKLSPNDIKKQSYEGVLNIFGGGWNLRAVWKLCWSGERDIAGTGPGADWESAAATSPPYTGYLRIHLTHSSKTAPDTLWLNSKPQNRNQMHSSQISIKFQYFAQVTIEPNIQYHKIQSVNANITL